MTRSFQNVPWSHQGAVKPLLEEEERNEGWFWGLVSLQLEYQLCMMPHKTRTLLPKKKKKVAVSPQELFCLVSFLGELSDFASDSSGNSAVHRDVKNKMYHTMACSLSG
jgi:hypothetical protein